MLLLPRRDGVVRAAVGEVVRRLLLRVHDILQRVVGRRARERLRGLPERRRLHDERRLVRRQRLRGGRAQHEVARAAPSVVRGERRVRVAGVELRWVRVHGVWRRPHLRHGEKRLGRQLLLLLLLLLHLHLLLLHLLLHLLLLLLLLHLLLLLLLGWDGVGCDGPNGEIFTR